MFWQYWGKEETFSAGDGVPAAPQHGVDREEAEFEHVLRAARQ